MIAPSVPVAHVASLSADGRAYRFQHHLLAAGPGRLLLVPIGLAFGDLRVVVDACPVPWLEVWALLDTERRPATPIPPEVMCRDHGQIAMISPYGWERDCLSLSQTKPNVDRYIHATGIVYARVKP